MNHDKQVKSKQGLELREIVRVICTDLPEVEEKVDSFGHTSFRVNDKPFVMMGEGEGSSSISFKTAPTTQEFLIQQDENRFFKTPYIGHHGWVSMNVDMPLDPREIEGLVREGYGRTAPKRLLRLLDK